MSGCVVEVVVGDHVLGFDLGGLGRGLPDLQDVLVTADALHCQREHATSLHVRGGHHLFTVKGNQPALRHTLVRLPWAGAPGQLERHCAHTQGSCKVVKQAG